jgi:hypothetical protein
MENILIFLAIVEVVLVYLVLYKIGRSKIILTPLLVIVTLEIIFTFPISLYWHFNYRLSDFNLLIVLSVPVLLVLGAVFAYRVKKKAYIRNDYVRKSLDGRYFSTLIVIGVLLAYAYYQGLPYIIQALFKITEDQSLASLASTFRFVMNKSYITGESSYSGQGIIKQFMRGAWYLISVYSILLYYDKSRILFKNKYRVYLIICGIVLFGSFEKHPIMWMVILLLMVYTINNNLRLSHVFKIVVYTLVPLVIVSSLLGRGASNSDYPIVGVVTALSERVMLGNGKCTLYALEESHERLGIGLGKQHMDQFLNSLPGKPSLPLGYYITKWETGGDNRKLTYCTPTYLGIVYSDFHFLGVIFIYIFIGFIAQIIFYKGVGAIKKKKDILNILWWVMLWPIFAQIQGGGIIGVLVDILIMSVLLTLTYLVVKFIKLLRK